MPLPDPDVVLDGVAVLSHHLLHRPHRGAGNAAPGIFLPVDAAYTEVLLALSLLRLPLPLLRAAAVAGDG